MGKSTLLRVLAGLVPQTSGKLYDPNMGIATTSLVDMEKTFREAGMADYSTAIPLGAMVDRRFQQEAVKRLNR